MGEINTLRTLGPSLQYLLIQLRNITLVLGLNGRTGQNTACTKIGLALLIPPQFHNLHLSRSPGVHGNGTDEGDVYSEGSIGHHHKMV
jgi:hypothetical protein